jgi:FkbM family methyltransferase
LVAQIAKNKKLHSVRGQGRRQVLNAPASLIKTARSVSRHLGIDLVRWRPQSSPDAALAKSLACHRIDTVLDIGANEGQYAKHLREVGFRGRIVSFEPLSGAYERMKATAAKDALWSVAPRGALGDENGELQMNVASNGGASSSIFGMMKAHHHAAPDVTYVASETVPVLRLDVAAEKFLRDRDRVFLKVDVQGYELHVLRGAAGILPRILGAEIEVSFAALYDGQPSFLTLTEWMLTRGFEIWGVIPGFADNFTGQILQADIIFFRN